MIFGMPLWACRCELCSVEIYKGRLCRACQEMVARLSTIADDTEMAFEAAMHTMKTQRQPATLETIIPILLG